MVALPKKALIAIPAKHFEFYEDGSETGLFYTEALHPYSVFAAAGFEVDLVSETGSFGLDAHSTEDQFLTEEDKAVYRDPEAPFSVSLNKNLKKAADVDPDDYGVFFAAAGHAAIYDYPGAAALQSVAQRIWDNGGIVAAICHGPAILPYVRDKETGKSIVNGKRITGFTTQGEIDLGLIERIKDDNAPLIENSAADAGAEYVAPAQPFDDLSITDGRVVTGANPASAHSAARRVVEAFEQL
ncbi:molecular chaperone Hsp31 [Amycolatopsis sp. AA4]|nr:molecular chaperone Hsp31 [Amycolatopsis sp. AA4]